MKIKEEFQNKYDVQNKLVDPNVVVGTPIISKSGSEIIPITAITYVDVGGSGEYGDVKTFKITDEFKIAGASGTIMTIKPKAFIIDDGNGCKLLKIDDTPLNNLIQKTGEIVSSITENNE